MKILFIINYASWLKIKGGEQPSHHLFGFYELIDYFETDDTAVLKSSIGGKIKFVCIQHRTLKEVLKVYIMSFKYELIFDSLCVVSKYLGVFNKYHLLKPRLVTIFHHPPFKKIMQYAKSDISIFFTEKLLNEARKYVTDKRIMFFNQWYPDVDFYSAKYNKENDKSKIIDFIDNGKTARDHNKFILSVTKLRQCTGLVVTDSKHIPEQYKNDGNIKLCFQDIPDDKKMLSILIHAKVMVIPLEKADSIIGPIGITSYLDAIALGMPVVAPYNAAFSDEIAENKLGVLYNPLKDDFSTELLEALNNYAFYANNMKRFAKKHTIMEYSKNIECAVLRRK